jgi:hypothetical protein
MAAAAVIYFRRVTLSIIQFAREKKLKFKQSGAAVISCAP